MSVMNHDRSWDYLSGCFLDLNGNPIERTPMTHPYSYQDFVVFKSPEFAHNQNWAYSDRLLEMDRLKFRQAVSHVWPELPTRQMFDGTTPEDLERFLRLYFDKPVKLTAVLQGCNVSNGYPYWIFAYTEEE